jgi:glycogen operon protein
VFEVRAGRAWPLGAHFDGKGTNFSVFSEAGKLVELCLFDEEGAEERLELTGREGPYWYGRVDKVQPGQRYGFRVHGPYEPMAGHRCNPHKLLLDPYARAIEGRLRWDPAVFGHVGADPFGAMSTLDSAPFVPRSVVVDTQFDWAGDQSPRHDWQDTVIYELHVKGFTAQHPDVPPQERGSYAGLAHPSVITYLQRLGVTAVELLPVHQFDDDAIVRSRGLSNYWGYATLGYFAPHNGFASSGQRGQQVTEFKRMVAALHRAGIEVLIDVVYNHSGEGNESGTTLCFRGLDNYAYYKHAPEAPGRYLDHTGCGNTLQTRHPQVLQLVMDSLRYWVEEMHIDGFRFDLAPALMRTAQWVDPFSAFLGALQQDPVLQRVKLIAEPWDLGSGGYQVGRFPAPFSEWNGKYRDSMREFWCRGGAGVGEFARRFTGSADLYRSAGRHPRASVNFVTCHDGFTLLDLLSYEKKRNEANGEYNRDGESHNRGWNCGNEGPSQDPVVQALRRRQQRNLLLTLLCSQGVPMLLAGDELGRTQHGNNNAYCQDGPISWLDWNTIDTGLLDFTRRMVHFVRGVPGLRLARWLDGRPSELSPEKDVSWFGPDGIEFGVLDWDRAARRALCVHVACHPEAPFEPVARELDRCLFLFNADAEAVPFTIPTAVAGPWRLAFDTAESERTGTERRAGEVMLLPPYSAQLYHAGPARFEG